jgi:hypothetical protein
VIGIGLNPFLIEPTIELMFSNQINYKARRNDFAQLLEEASSVGKNQIAAAIRSYTADNTFMVDVDWIMK